MFSMLLINREFEKCLFSKFENKDWAESKKKCRGELENKTDNCTVLDRHRKRRILAQRK